MTHEQSANAVAILNAGFPREALEPATVKLWIAELSILHDARIATEAALRIVRTGDRFPSLKEFRQVYRAVAEQERANIPALPEPKGSTTLPGWIHVWHWLRWEKREMDLLPQQSHLSGTGMTSAEYDEAHEAWQQAGSPKIQGVADITKALSGRTT